MKIRAGFVSNSSSSSFVIALKEKPESAEELHDIMFPSGPTFVSGYYDAIPSVTAAASVYNNLTELDGRGLFEEFNNGYIPGYEVEYPLILWDKTPKEERDRIYEEYRDKQNVETQRCVDEFKKRTPGCKYFIVEYSDNDGEFYSTMEHGDAFDNLEHVKVSHH
jgi:hypothetical protein